MVKIKSKRKLAVSVIAVFMALVIAAGAYGFFGFYKPVNYKVSSVKSDSRISDDYLTLVAHRGFRAKAPENTIPAYEEAGKAGYKGAECDIFRTSDGVWVLQHDPNSFRMMGKVMNIEDSSYKELSKLTVNNGNNVKNYKNLKIATLDEYLSVCDKYNMIAVIELKSQNNTNYYKEIINLISKHKCPYQFISFYPECLKKMRALDNSVELFYLVDVITEESIETAKSIGYCGISFNAGKKKNFNNDGELIKTAGGNGIHLAAWTVDSVDQIAILNSYGVGIITTNCITY